MCERVKKLSPLRRHPPRLTFARVGRLLFSKFNWKLIKCIGCTMLTSLCNGCFGKFNKYLLTISII